MVAQWTLILRSHTGSVLTELIDSRDIGISRELNRPMDIGGTLDQSSPQAVKYQDALGNGIPQLLGYREESGTKTLRFAGLWTPDTEDADPNGAAINWTFRDPLATLDQRVTAELYDPVGLGFTDAGEILEALIDNANTDSNTFLATGDIEATVDRDVTYEWKSIGEAGRELQELDLGFDVTVTPSTSASTLGTLAVVADAGGFVEAARFAHGGGTQDNCQQVSRERRAPRNHVIVIGDQGVSVEVSDTASIAVYGKWTHVENLTDQVDADVLLGRGQSLLRPNPIEIVTFTAEPALAPQPWEDYDIGDTVPIYVNRDAFQADTTARVIGISIDLDDDLRETSHVIQVEKDNS